MAKSVKRLLIAKDELVVKELDYLVKQLIHKDDAQIKLTRSKKPITSTDVGNYTEENIILDEVNKVLVFKIGSKLYKTSLTEV